MNNYWHSNPILKRELISFERGWKMPVLIATYNGIMVMLLIGLYSLMNGNNFGSGSVDLNFMRGLYYFVTFSQLILLLLMVPALTAGSISGERQRGTLEILLVSAKSKRMILLGKLQAGLYSFVVLLISSLPLYTVLGVYGGIQVWDVVGNMLLLTVLAIFYGSIGIMCSSWFRKHQTSMVLTYVIVFLISALTLVITTISTGIFALVLNKEPSSWTGALLYMNPFVVMLTHLDVQMSSRTNLLAMFSDYSPGISLGIMVVVHLALALVFSKFAEMGLKRLNN